MNKLTRTVRIQILRCLVEGCSLRATSRMGDVSINTVTKLLIDAGRVAAAHQDLALRDLPCKRIECDEIWAFVGAKDKTIERAARKGETVDGSGSIWTWTAICADTKIVPSFMVGARDASVADVFMRDLASRLRYRVQLTADGHKPYLKAVDDAFGLDIDYAMLIKEYGLPTEGPPQERKYSPPEVTRCEKIRICGGPDEAKVSTSYVERLNLTTRMQVRRFTRLTNAFSKKEENHLHAVSLHFWFYNFARIHKTLRVTPAMAAGVTENVLDLADLVALMEAEEDTAADVAARRKDRHPESN